MSKFKVGDEVMVVRNVRGYGTLGVDSRSYLNRIFVISRTTPDQRIVFPEGDFGALAEDCELYAVVNTPLWKALK